MALPRRTCAPLIVSVYLIVQWVILLHLGPEAAAKSPPCSPDLESCPQRGCAVKGSADALLNSLKHRKSTTETLTTLTLADFETLQNEADTLVGQKRSLDTKARAKLKHVKVENGTVSEGDLVEVVGYIVGLDKGLPRANTSGESVNCRLTGAANNDYHIPIARSPDDTEFDAIVIEMIPQDRPEGWSLRKLRAIGKEQHAVRVRGQLFYDNKHVVNSDPIEPIGGQPARFSLWEIHPVTEFYVCFRPDNACEPSDTTQWKSLETFE